LLSIPFTGTPVVLGQEELLPLETTSSLEQQILEGMKRGEAVAEEVSRWTELRAGAPRRPERSRSREAAELRQALAGFQQRSRPLVGSGARPAAGQILALLPAYDALRAADLLFRERFTTVAAKLEQAGVGDEIVARLNAAEARYYEQRDRFLTPLEGPMEALRSARDAGETASVEMQTAALSALAATRGWLAENLEDEVPVILRTSLLPYGPGQLAPRELVDTPTLVPSYLDPSDPAPLAADLAPTLEAPFSEAILRQADELGNDYVRIYEFVRNEIDTEWYAGSMKGAEGALLQRSGNDVDQASLLTALLRASQAAARYVQGIIELPIETLAADLGVAEGDVTTVLSRSGVAHEVVIRGGRIAAIELEHTWVSVHVPYANYRGAVVDFSGPIWLPLFPALKRYQHTPASGVLGDMGLTADEVLTDYLSVPQSREPLAELRQRVEDYLEQNAQGVSYEDQLATRTLVGEVLGLLPSSLPVEVVAVTAEQAELADTKRHRVRVVVRAGESETDPVLLDHTVTLGEILGGRVTLSYQPATVDDQTTVNLFGGLDAVPLYLIELRPRFMIGGRIAAVGEGADSGIRQRLEIELTGPFGSESVSQTLISGNYYALALTGQQDEPKPVVEDDPADSEQLGARLLSQVALGYSRRWGESEEELGRLLDVAVFRPLPALAIAANAVDVEMLFGLPIELDWEGVTLDAAMRVAEPLARTGDPSLGPDWMRLSALQGSAVEHFLFEDEFLVDSISADKGLGLARDAGIEVVTIDDQNIGTLLPLLLHPTKVVEEIENWVRLGMVVEVPVEPITHNAWSGSVWRVEDPATGAGGYFIAGGLAGGATTEEDWILDFLEDAFGSPNSPPPNTDPLAGVEIVKIGASDGQQGTVDEVLPKQLGVQVRDKDGRPVKEAPVEFSVTTGGGKLIDSEGAEVDSLVVLTNEQGIALVGFKLGKSTSESPVYTLRNPDDKYATQALQNYVDALGIGAAGPLVPVSPFQALALPGEPAELVVTDGASPFGTAGLWSASVDVRVDDEFNNPVSNVPVTYAVGAAVPQCSNVGAFDNAVVFDNTSDATGPAACLIDQPVLGDCGVPAYTDTSSVRGTNAGIILGSAASTIYNVDATSPGLSPQSFAVESFGPCNGGPIVGYNTTNLADEFGNNISAAKTGETYKRPVQVTLLYSDPDFVVKVDSQGEYYIDYLPTSTWVRTTGNVVFNVASGGSASPAVFVGDGTYETLVTTGPAPTSNLVSFNGTQIQVTLDRVNKDTGEVFQETVERALSGDLFPVWGVDPTILQITPDPLILTSAGRTVEEGAVHYQILPTLYSSFFSNVDLLEEGEITATAIADRTGEGSVSIPRGFTFDINKSYETRMILNRGSDAEVKGDPEPVPLYQQIFENVDRAISVSQDVDLLNERICAFGSNFTYTTTQEATITLKFKRIQSENPDGSPNFGDEEIFIDGELQPPGDHEFPITPSDLLPADYVFELIGVSSVDGHEEIVEGFARSEFKTRDSLPVGHVVVKGVDLFTGHLSVARQDFQLPGRGVPIGFSRHYSSNSPTDGGSLGIGWSHSLGSRIILTPCGEAIVIGGQGSGQRFVDDGQGGLRPLSGFHGSLVGNTEDNTFDFYSKDGTRHHYVSSSPREWRIEFVADTNGNATEYVYDSTGKDANLVAVRDSGGRTIQLVYEEKLFRYWGGDVITSVTASGDYAISFEYDEYGNLTLASREEGVQVESYAYATEPDDPFEDRHLLTSTTNELNGATTSYGYERATIGIQGNVQIPSVFVSQLMEPEGGITAFTYDLTSLSSRGPPQLTTQVTDPRDQITSYTLNQYGSPREIVDPEGNTTAMTWATDDVVMLSSTDGNDITTTFTYDDHANLKSETVTVTHFDGSTDTFITLKTYKLPTAFDPPYLKSRVHTRTNRNGAVTTFDYDAHGNLTSEEITVQTVDGSRTYVTSHTYESNGDRKSTTDPRNFTTFFSYDAYGNLSRVTDPEDHQSETIFNIRSQPETQIDALNRTTTFRYDSLNRRTATIYPDDTVEETLYDDINRQIFETDGEDRVTRSDYDLEGRVLRIVNAEDGIKEFEFDLAGNKTLESSWFDQDTPRFDTIFTYDNAGRLQTRTEPLGRITTYSYDGVGNVTNETIVGPGMAPRVTNTSYDGLNRPIVITQQNNDGPVVTKIKYDGEGNRVLEVDPLERETSSQYDGLNRLIQKTEPLGRITQFLYDGNGNLLEERRANTTGEQVRIFEYDRNNRLTSRKDALKEETIFEYDPAGNIERRIDPRLHVITFDYDDRDRLEKETRKRALGDVVTEFDYDRVGNLTEQRLPNNNVIIRTYDELNRLKTESDTLGPLATFDYDARGNIIEQTDANDNLAETDYDELDRVTEQRLPEDRKLTFTYDAVDNVLTRTDARRNTTTFEYDRLNRLTKTVDPAPFSYTVESEYDRAGNRLSEKDRRGNVTVFEYDDLNRLERIIDPPPLSFVREFTYDTLGNQITEKDRRDILLEFEYDLENRLLKTTRAGLVIEEIEYDQNGNRRFVTDANRNITGFEYDELDRLTAENRPLAAITRFTLDEIGNIREERDPENRITVRDYDLRQRLTIETNDANETTEFGSNQRDHCLRLRRQRQSHIRSGCQQ
jgi:YD repeat-containing protein